MHLLLFSQNDTGERIRGSLWWGSLALLAGSLLVVVLGRTVFFVDETEYVYVTQFGRPLRLYIEAGLGVKWPYQSLRRFDRRLQMFEPQGREMLTEDKENLTFEWFVCWRIARSSASQQAGEDLSPDARVDVERNVLRFLQSLGSVQAAENRLEERIQAALAAEIGRTQFSQLCNLDTDQLRLKSIAQRVTQRVRDLAAEQFGIEVVDVRLKRFNYPEAVKPAVYAEIRSERQRVAVQYRAEGASERDRIESLADLQRETLLAEARRDAAAIRGKADAKAIEIYNAAHQRNPQFYELLKTLETYRAVLDDQTTVVLSAESPLLRLLTRGLPELPAPRNQPSTTTAGTTQPADLDPKPGEYKRVEGNAGVDSVIDE